MTLVSCLPSYSGTTVSPTSQSVFAGGIVAYQLSTLGDCGFHDSLTFSVTGLPAGVTASITPASIVTGGSSTLTVSTATNTAAGTSSLTIHTLDAGTDLEDNAATLVVTADTANFTLASSPTSQSVAQGLTATYNVTVTYANKFRGTVMLTAAGLPPGATATFTPSSFTASGTSTLSMTTGTGTPLGTYPIAITATSGSSGRVTGITLGVTQPYGTISGVVNQSDGVTPVSGARVEYFQGGVSLGFVTSATNGSYTIGNLIAGNFAVFCSASSYKTYISSGVIVSPNATATVNFSLPTAPTSTLSSSSAKEYIRLADKIVAIEPVALNLNSIDFETYTGDNNGIVALPSATVGSGTFAGGQIFPLTSNLPADLTVLYASGDPSFGWCNACAGSITISFAQPTVNLSFFVFNGQTFDVTYTIQDDRGGLQSVVIPPNYSSGAALVTFLSSGISQVTISSSLSGGGWDFSIDSVSYTAVSGSAPMAPTGAGSIPAKPNSTILVDVRSRVTGSTAGSPARPGH